MIQNTLILSIYIIISILCIVFLISYRIKKTKKSLAVSAILFIVLGQLIAYMFQIYRVIHHIINETVEYYTIDYIITYIFIGRIPEIIGISIFFVLYYSLNYRKK
jgi:L-cystine uptake protein TcyP (sodium:dicarboxylate symporter family)